MWKKVFVKPCSHGHFNIEKPNDPHENLIYENITK